MTILEQKHAKAMYLLGLAIGGLGAILDMPGTQPTYERTMIEKLFSELTLEIQESFYFVPTSQ